MVFNLLTLCSGTLLVGLGTRLMVLDGVMAWPLIVLGGVLLLVGQTVARYDDIPGYQEKKNWLQRKLRKGTLAAKTQSSANNGNIPTAPPVR